MTVDTEAVLENYLDYWKNLTRESVGKLSELAADDMRFRDPFNDAQGLDAVIACFGEMFDVLETFDFDFRDRAVTGRVAFATWTMHLVPKRAPGRKQWSIEGASRIELGEDGQIIDHFDYWDATPLFESVPLLGLAIRFVKRRMT